MSPSHLRREGRNAFDPFTDPMDIQPFFKGSWAYEYDLPHWLDGWEEARKDYEKEKAEHFCQKVKCPYCGETITITLD